MEPEGHDEREDEMRAVWTIEREARDGFVQRREVLRDEAGHWFTRTSEHEEWTMLDEPHDVEVYEALRAVGLA